MSQINVKLRLCQYVCPPNPKRLAEHAKGSLYFCNIQISGRNFRLAASIFVMCGRNFRYFLFVFQVVEVNLQRFG